MMGDSFPGYRSRGGARGREEWSPNSVRFAKFAKKGGVAVFERPDTCSMFSETGRHRITMSAPILSRQKKARASRNSVRIWLFLWPCAGRWMPAMGSCGGRVRKPLPVDQASRFLSCFISSLSFVSFVLFLSGSREANLSIACSVWIVWTCAFRARGR